MRKYYQLLLVILCIISFAVLLMYKSENNRLKYVLKVVNFFGRKDSAALLRLEEEEIDHIYEPALPLPLWSSIGNGFHIYAAYWKNTDLSEGGEAFGMVVGSQRASIGYQCYLKYSNGKMDKGKFNFKEVEYKNPSKNFNTYCFICTLAHGFEMPESVVFMERDLKEQHEIKLRQIKSIVNTKQRLISNRNNLMTICVNMVKAEFPSGFTNKDNLLQLFVSHKLIGVNQFSIYNGDAISPNIRLMINNVGLNVHYYPFNFPYAMSNASENIRQIIETDCIMRNWNNFEYALLLSPNEFFYPKKNIDDNSFHSLRNLSKEVLRFQIPSFAVCLDKQKKFLIDNNFYDPEVRFDHKLFIYRTQGRVLPPTMGINTDADIKNRSISLLISEAISHRYVDCVNVGQYDGLHNWRTTLKEDFLIQFKTRRAEMSSLKIIL